jgi:hypothetical protein
MSAAGDVREVQRIADADVFRGFFLGCVPTIVEFHESGFTVLAESG